VIDMTEGEWLAATNPRVLLEFRRRKTSDRKLRLFACGYCLQIRWLGEEGENAVAVAERFADGLVGESALVTAAARLDNQPIRDERILNFGVLAIACLCTDLNVGTHLPNLAELPGLLENTAVVRLIRDIFGNPFRPVTFDPSWRTSTVVALAQQMYESRDFAPMPILADALQDAGCDHPDILAHCRDPVPAHVRGCWVVDLILGKE
jgi:hypothetical protein